MLLATGRRCATARGEVFKPCDWSKLPKQRSDRQRDWLVGFSDHAHALGFGGEGLACTGLSLGSASNGQHQFHVSPFGSKEVDRHDWYKFIVRRPMTGRSKLSIRCLADFVRHRQSLQTQLLEVRGVVHTAVSGQSSFTNYLRMDPNTYHTLLYKIRPYIIKQDTNMRASITPDAWLEDK
ncbi:hypothetical protein GWK47_038256 [Chionoecetes opilio]|uniref:Uncharacterized protein n=1 Tax=Chionoecetes opilio TaxID=41210 RepID=A0A8J5CYR8_CHIOP|nr:hypothetical protein GWK47_038256 [Chionoecetes opilio]